MNWKRSVLNALIQLILGHEFKFQLVNWNTCWNQFTMVAWESRSYCYLIKLLLGKWLSHNAIEDMVLWRRVMVIKYGSSGEY